MQIAEARLDQAVRVEREQRQRLRWVGYTGASYALDLVFLLLYWGAGTVTGAVPAGYAAAAFAAVGGNYLAYVSGWNLKVRDPSLTAPMVLVGVAVQLGVVAFAPQLAFPVLANIFTVFAFGVIWMTLRTSLVIWLATLAAAGAVIAAAGSRAGLPVSTPMELALTWLFFGAILGRCLLLGVYANELRAKVAEGRRRLAASLEQIQVLVHYDELTKVYNRRSLLDRLEQERSRAERTGTVFSVALMDLDHFKSINDTHGHGVGDEVLKAFAGACQATMRESDVFGRYGGEEFLAILPATTPAFAAIAVDRIRGGVSLQAWGGLAPGLTLTVSVGVATFRPGESLSQLLARADAALYEAKAAGRDRVVIKEQS